MVNFCCCLLSVAIGSEACPIQPCPHWPASANSLHNMAARFLTFFYVAKVSVELKSCVLLACTLLSSGVFGNYNCSGTYLKRPAKYRKSLLVQSHTAAITYSDGSLTLQSDICAIGHCLNYYVRLNIKSLCTTLIGTQYAGNEHNTS